MDHLELVSHDLCPYVQRAAIALAERSAPFSRTMISLAEKPDWFLALSPLGKVPLLRTARGVLFESVPIIEYLEDVFAHKLHPADPFERATHRAWIEFGSGILNDIAGLYNAADKESFERRSVLLHDKFARLEAELSDGPYFSGASFSLVDAVYGPVFRYWDVFDAIGDFGVLRELPKVLAWRRALAARPSVRGTVGPEYGTLLQRFLAAKPGYLGALARAIEA
jgi:glutathione S-transferase